MRKRVKGPATWADAFHYPCLSRSALKERGCALFALVVAAVSVPTRTGSWEKIVRHCQRDEPRANEAADCIAVEAGRFARLPPRRPARHLYVYTNAGHASAGQMGGR